MADWLQHLLGRTCCQPVAGHEFVEAAHPAWHGFRGCIWLPHPQANRCMMPRRCHVAELGGSPVITAAVPDRKKKRQG